MGNWVIYESICRSKSLRQCSGLAQDNFFRFILYADGYGCFEVDLDDMKVNLFRYRKGIGVIKILQLLLEYYQTGHLLIWSENGRVYGFLVKWEEYTGSYLSRRGKRKTPEPPQDIVNNYCQNVDKKTLDTSCFKSLQVEAQNKKGIRI